jgi:hypothetical protein
MIEEEGTKPEEIIEPEAKQTVVEEQTVEEPVVVGDVIVVDPYASQAHLPDEERTWPPIPVKHRG